MIDVPNPSNHISKKKCIELLYNKCLPKKKGGAYDENPENNNTYNETIANMNNNFSTMKLFKYQAINGDGINDGLPVYLFCTDTTSKIVYGKNALAFYLYTINSGFTKMETMLMNIVPIPLKLLIVKLNKKEEWNHHDIVTNIDAIEKNAILKSANFWVNNLTQQVSTFEDEQKQQVKIEILIVSRVIDYLKSQGGGARRRVNKSSKTPSNGKKATSKRVNVSGKERVVYEGSRGGQYVKMSGNYVSLKELKL